MAKRNSAFRLIAMVVLAVVIFMGLALGEDIARGFVKRWRDRVTITGAATDMGETVKRYDQTLMQAYAQDKPSLLAAVATDHQITKVRLYMTYDQIEKKRKLIIKLKSLSIDKAKRIKKKGTVLTTEIWENSYIDLRTKKESNKQVESYKVQYNLIMRGSHWLVDSLEAEKI